MTKTERMSGVEKAQCLALEIMAEFPAKLHAGMSEKDAAEALRSLCLARPSVEQALTDMVLSGPNSTQFHRFASDRIIRPHELILIDFSIVVDGWFSDMTRMFSIGEPEPEAVQICSLLERICAEMAQAAHSGVCCGDLYDLAMEKIRHAGYGTFFPHRLGHGIGREMHEAPSLASGSPGDLSARPLRGAS